MSENEDIEMVEDSLPCCSRNVPLPRGADLTLLPARSTRSTAAKNLHIDIEDAEIITSGADSESSNQFLMSLVEYIIDYSRILECHKASTWQTYLDEDRLSVNKEKKITCARLRDFFVKRMLPRIYKYEMAEACKEQFKVLELNEVFERIPEGYVYKAAIKYDMPLQYEVDYDVLDAIDIDKEEERRRREVNVQDSEDVEMVDADEPFILETQKSNPLPSQFYIVTGTGAVPHTARPKLPPRLSAEIRALLSTVVSYDYEIFHRACIDEATMLSRLRSSRALFMKNGRQSITLEPERLLHKVELMTTLRKCTIKIMHKRF